MHTFRDAEGREWQIAVNVATIKRVRDALDLDLLAAGDPDPTKDAIVRLAGDPILLADTLFVLCREQAETRGVTDEQFGAALAGDPIDRATEALLAEIVDFTPAPRDRERGRKVLQKMNQVIERGRDLLDQRLNDPELDEKLLCELKRSIGTAGGSPASAESTPDPSPSES